MWLLFLEKSRPLRSSYGRKPEPGQTGGRTPIRQLPQFQVESPPNLGYNKKQLFQTVSNFTETDPRRKRSMTKKRSLDTICIQGGWEPKNGEPRQLPIYQSTTFKYTSSEQMGVCLIWKKTDISIQDWQTPPMTRSQPRSASWRAVWVPCLLPQARRLIFMR